MARLLAESLLKRISPPWLQRAVGGAIMESLGASIDTVTDDTANGVKLRFPNSDNPEALGHIGRERRFLRGPGESGTGFASRMLRWWDAHRRRGGPYEMLQQLHEFFLDSNNVPIDLIANSGMHHSITAAGAITREGTIASWSGDGFYPTKWGRIFLFFTLPGTAFSLPLLSESGEPVLTEGGEQILSEIEITALTSADIDIICAVPREWSAAHIDRIYIGLFPPGGVVYGFPVTTAYGDPGLTYGDNGAVIITC